MWCYQSQMLPSLYSFWALVSHKEFRSRFDYLSSIDKGELLVKRLNETDPSVNTLLNALHANDRIRDRQASLRDFLHENRFELKPIMDKLYTFDLKSLSVTRGSDPRLGLMKRLIAGYSPGHPLCRFLPFSIRSRVNDMFLRPASQGYYDLINDSVITEHGPCVVRHTNFNAVHAEQVPSCQGVALGEGLYAFERPTSPGGRRDHPWIIFDMLRGHLCSMGKYSPSTFRILPDIKSVILVENGNLVLFRPLLEPLSLFTWETIKIKQVSKSSEGGYHVLLLAARTYMLISLSLDGQVKRRLAIGHYTTHRIKLDGDLVEVSDPSYSTVCVNRLSVGGVGLGSFPNPIEEDYTLLADSSGPSTSFAVAFAQRERITRFFICFCNTYQTVITQRDDALGSICRHLHEDESETLAGSGAWPEITALIQGKPHGMVALNGMLLDIIRS